MTVSCQVAYLDLYWRPTQLLFLGFGVVGLKVGIFSPPSLAAY